MSKSLNSSINSTFDLGIAIKSLQQEIKKKSVVKWDFREKYFDLGNFRRPLYIIEFRESNIDHGDDLYDEETFSVYPTLSNSPGSGKRQIYNLAHTTRSENPSFGLVNNPYWRKISSNELINCFEKFLVMYKENYFQPPGILQFSKEKKLAHDSFEKLGFDFIITNGIKEIKGIGPLIFSQQIGAIRGRLLNESKVPLANVRIMLNIRQIIGEIEKSIELERFTDKNGNYWFSKIPTGENYRHTIRIDKKEILSYKTENEDFGTIKGKIIGKKKISLTNQIIKFYSPDNEVFIYNTDKDGSYYSLLLPAIKYRIEIEDNIFAIKKILPYKMKESYIEELEENIEGDEENLQELLKDSYIEPINDSQSSFNSNDSKIPGKRK